MIEPKKIELQKLNRSLINLRILNEKLLIEAISQKSSFRQGYENISLTSSQKGNFNFNPSRTSSLAKDSFKKNNTFDATKNNNSIIKMNNDGITNVRKSVQQILFGLNRTNSQYKPKSTMHFNMNFYFDSHHSDQKKKALSSLKRNSASGEEADQPISEHKGKVICNFDEDLEKFLAQAKEQLENKRERKAQNDFFENKQDPLSSEFQANYNSSENLSLKRSQLSFMRISSRKKSTDNNKKIGYKRSSTVASPTLKPSFKHNYNTKKVFKKTNNTLFSGMLKKFFGKPIGVLDDFPKEGNLIDFNLEDFKYFERTKKDQGEKIAMELQLLKERSLLLNLSGDLKVKWQNARRRLMLGVKMNRFNDDIKIYGSSINAGIELGKKELYNCIIQQDQMKMIKKNKKNVKEEQTLSRLLFLPNDKIVKFWSYILASVMIYTATITPFRIAFIKNDDSDIFTFFDYLSDALFMIDICINLNLAYYDYSNHLIASRKKIFLRYLFSWLIIDIIGIFPFETVINQNDSIPDDSTNNAGGYNDFAKLLRLPRLYRLVKISRLFKFMKSSAVGNLISNLQLFLRINSSLIRVIKFILTVILMVHILGCLWYFEAQLQDFAPNTWVSKLFF